MESPYKRASTILCSQFDIPGWRDKLVDPILADAICDRTVHDSYTVIIAGQESMRKKKRDDTGTVLPFGTFTVNRQNRPRLSLQQELLVL